MFYQKKNLNHKNLFFHTSILSYMFVKNLTKSKISATRICHTQYHCQLYEQNCYSSLFGIILTYHIFILNQQHEFAKSHEQKYLL